MHISYIYIYAGLCVSLVLKYCDSLVKGFSTSVSVILAMAVSSVLFGFELTRPFAIGSAVVCCAFYLYFGHFNQVLGTWGLGTRG